MATLQELRDEERRMRQMRHLVSFATAVIMQGQLSRPEARELVDAMRARILELFPGQDETYEILYARRFARLIEEFTPAESVRPMGRILPFRKPGE